MSSVDSNHNITSSPALSPQSVDSYSAAAGSVSSTDEKTQNCVEWFFSEIAKFFIYLGNRALAPIVVPAEGMKATSDEKQQVLNLDGKEVNFVTEDNVNINGMYFNGNDVPESNRTVIIFNGNGALYEQNSQLIEDYKRFGWNVFVFNYRGTGDSEGCVTRDGLVSDGEAALQYVKDNYQVADENTLLHGWSLGGGVAGKVAASHPKVNYCNDRSFSSLTQEVKVLFGDGILGTIAMKILGFFDWEFDSVENFKKIEGKKIVVYSKDDQVIPEGARFYEQVEDVQGIERLMLIKDRYNPDNEHCRLYGVLEKFIFIDYIEEIGVKKVDSLLKLKKLFSTETAINRFE